MGNVLWAIDGVVFGWMGFLSVEEKRGDIVGMGGVGWRTVLDGWRQKGVDGGYECGWEG